MAKLLVATCMLLTLMFLNTLSVAQTQNTLVSATPCEQVLETHQDVALASHLDQHTIASVARCRVQMLDNLQAARWYEQIADMGDCAPEYLLEYGQCLKSLKLYGKAKFYFQKYAQTDATVGNQLMQSCDIAKMMMAADPMYTITALTLNSTTSEFAPCPMADMIVFNNWGTTSSLTKLHSIQSVSGKATEFAVDNNIPEGISHVRYSGDGKYVTFATSAFEPDQRLIPSPTGTKIYLAELTGTGKWSNVFSMPFCADTYSFAYPSLAPDGSKMYFASTMPGGKGGWDIYMSKRNGETWSDPENLGSGVNTPGNEISPFVIADRIYFSSDRHIGIGGFDVFVALVSGNEMMDIRNLGYPVNSPKDDLDFVWDAANDCAYLASNRIGGIGLYDLYKATEEFYEVHVSVKHKENMKPIGDVAITMMPGSSMTYYTNNQGSIMIPMPSNGEYQIILKKQGYQEQKVTLTKQNSLSYDVYLEPASTANATTKIADAPKEIKQESKPYTKTETPIVNSSPESKPVQSVKQVSQSKEMYFIQIAALARHSSLEGYGDLRSYGDLLLHDDGKYAKVRVGTFATDAEAKLVLARIKANGYKDAFVVKHAVNYNAQAKQTSDIINEYKVRLATYAKVGNFDPSHIMHLGSIESYRKDDLTIMLLAGYSTLAAAKEARDAAASQGFADAYVVMDNGGILERVR